MEKRRMGTRGPGVSVLGLGCNNFGMKLDEAQSREVVEAALAAGVTHFDTAESYGGGRSEEYLGAALGGRRDQVVIATKFAARPDGEEYRPGLLRRRIMEGCETSLRRLGTDHIDLYYQHHPDPAAPLEETLGALDELIQAGKVVHAGCSNFSAAQIDEAARIAGETRGAGFAAAQMHWNLLERRVEADVVPAALRAGSGIIPYFPLASGMLTGKYGKDEFPVGSRLEAMPRFRGPATDENFAYIERLRVFAEEREHTLLELAFGWLAAQEGVASIIAGATSAAQVAVNAAAVTAWRLTPYDLQALPTRE